MIDGRDKINMVLFRFVLVYATQWVKWLRGYKQPNQIGTTLLGNKNAMQSNQIKSDQIKYALLD